MHDLYEGVRLARQATPLMELAAALGITTQAISQWRRVPADRTLDVERITHVPRYKLRPDLYPPDDYIDSRRPDEEHA